MSLQSSFSSIGFNSVKDNAQNLMRCMHLPHVMPLPPSDRRQNLRESCYEAATAWWRPSWDPKAVDATAYIGATQGQSVQQVIKKAGLQL